MATHHDFTDLTGALVIAENRLLYVAVPDEQPLAEVRRTPRDIRTLPIIHVHACKAARILLSLPIESILGPSHAARRHRDPPPRRSTTESTSARTKCSYTSPSSRISAH